jgi:hypothetical protein
MDETTARTIIDAQLEAEEAAAELAQFPPHMQPAIRGWLVTTLSPQAQLWFAVIG